MTKAELIKKIVSKSDLNLTQAEHALNAFLKAMEEILVQEGKATLTGFGTLSVEKRKARSGRNPRTGKPLTIPATNVVKFRAGKNLKDSVK